MHQALNSRPPKASGLVLKKKDGGGEAIMGRHGKKMGIKMFLFAPQWGRALINAFPDAFPCQNTTWRHPKTAEAPRQTTLPFLLPFLMLYNLEHLVSLLSLSKHCSETDNKLTQAPQERLLL